MIGRTPAPLSWICGVAELQHPYRGYVEWLDSSTPIVDMWSGSTPAPLSWICGVAELQHPYRGYVEWLNSSTPIVDMMSGRIPAPLSWICGVAGLQHPNRGYVEWQDSSTPIVDMWSGRTPAPLSWIRRVAGLQHSYRGYGVALPCKRGWVRARDCSNISEERLLDPDLKMNLNVRDRGHANAMGEKQVNKLHVSKWAARTAPERPKTCEQ